MFKILIVDDESLVRKGIVLETDWEALGCIVVGEAADGIEGIEAVHKYHPDLIICDIRMPHMNGIEMVSKLREEGCKAYVIYLTAYSDFSYAQKAIQLAATDYLLKPFEDGVLEQAVLKVKEKIVEVQNAGNKRHEEDVLSHENIKKGDKSKYVMEAIELITKNYGEYDLGVKMIAEHLELSESRLSHVFKKETDYTVNAYITRYRMQTAMRMLKDCRIKVYEIADMVGYRDVTYFSTIFKKITGINPSEYQDRIHNQ